MVCLVTGSSRGLGKSAALLLGNKGHKVVVHYRNKKTDAEQVAQRIKESLVLKADVANFAEVESLVEKVIEKWGRIDVLVNNAGITKDALLIKTSADNFDDVINTNLKGAFNLIRAVGHHMMNQKSGHIINISSYAGIKGKEGLSAYSASKAGLIGLTRSCAIELGGYNVMINAVLPGYMLTDMGMESSSRGKDTALKESIVKEFTDPDNIAGFIAYLSDTKGVTGQVFNLDSRVI
jgi:3-oxoacyl-[acyl-carrier protein] reductase